jgi:DNA-binding beta-propeller fold protein YncE
MRPAKFGLLTLIPLMIASFAAVRHTNAYQQSSPTPQPEIWMMADQYAYLLTDTGPNQPGKLEVGEKTHHVVPSPDGRILALASYGAIDTHQTTSGFTEFWPKRGSGSAITLLKRPGNEILGRYPVPFRPRYLTFTPDGASLIIASFGQYSGNEKKRIPAQLCALDVASGKLRNLVEMLEISDGYWFLPEERLVMLPGWGASPASIAGEKMAVQPELVTCNLATGAVERVRLPAAPGEWFDSGDEKMRYLTLKNGVAVVGADGKLIGAPITAGELNTFFVRMPDSKRFFLAGRTKKQGRVVVIEDGKVIKSFDLAQPGYLAFNADRLRIFLCASQQGIILDAGTLDEVGRIPLPDSFREVKFAPGEKKLYVAEIGDQVSAYDLESKQQIARFVSGRGKMKFLIATLTAAHDMLQNLNNQINHTNYAPRQYTHIPAAVQSLAFSPSGNFVYVSNDLTSDITVVETKGHTVLRKVAMGLPEQNRFIYQIAEGRRLIAGSSSKLLIFDTEKGETLVEREFPNAKPFFDPTLGLVVVVGKNGSEVWRPDPFEKIKDLAPGERIFFKPEARRFVIFGDKGMRLYDYELNLRREMESVLKRYQLMNELYSDNLHIVPPALLTTGSRSEKN